MGIIHSTMSAFSFVIERILSWIACACLSMCLLLAMIIMCMYGISVGYHYAQREMAQWTATYKYYHRPEYKNFGPDFTLTKDGALNDSLMINSTNLNLNLTGYGNNSSTRNNEILNPSLKNSSLEPDLYTEGILNTDAENQTTRNVKLATEVFSRENETTTLKVTVMENDADEVDGAHTKLYKKSVNWNVSLPSEMFINNTSETGLPKIMNYFTAFLPF